jgi:transcriptional regulator with XRE-family HTH domain
MLQRDLADAAEISVGYLSEVENGHRTPGAEILLRIANALGASLDYLARGEESRLTSEPLTIPTSLDEAAEDQQWSYAVTASLLRAQSAVRFRRTPTGQSAKPTREWTKDDWIQLHQLLYDDE